MDRLLPLFPSSTPMGSVWTCVVQKISRKHVPKKSYPFPVILIFWVVSGVILLDTQAVNEKKSDKLE
jgi:hypothetical protein